MDSDIELSSWPRGLALASSGPHPHPHGQPFAFSAQSLACFRSSQHRCCSALLSAVREVVAESNEKIKLQARNVHEKKQWNSSRLWACTLHLAAASCGIGQCPMSYVFRRSFSDPWGPHLGMNTRVEPLKGLVILHNVTTGQIMKDRDRVWELAVRRNFVGPKFANPQTAALSGWRL